MSFATIWSGNFHQIRSCMGSSCSFRILKSHAVFLPGKQLDRRMCCVRPLSTKIEEMNQMSGSSDSCDNNLRIPGGIIEMLKGIDKKGSDFHEYKFPQHYGVQKISEDKVNDRPITILVIDIETTGFNINHERIIEIAIRDLSGGKNSTFQTLINPGIAVPNTNIHGISSDMVRRPGVPSFEELIPILLQFVSSRQRSGGPVLWIAHNARKFDVPFLIRAFKRCYVEIPETWCFLDTLGLGRQLRMPDGSKLKSHKLKALREHYGITCAGPAHRAMQDVNVLARIFQHLTFDLKTTMPDLMKIAFRPGDIVKPR